MFLAARWHGEFGHKYIVYTMILFFQPAEKSLDNGPRHKTTHHCSSDLDSKFKFLNTACV